MSDHEIFKLKKELVAQRKLIEQQKHELKLKEASHINLEEEADFHQNEAKGMQDQMRRMHETLQEKEKIIQNDNPHMKERLHKDLKEKELAYEQELQAHKKTNVQLEAAETQLQIWKDSLRQAAIKLNDDTIERDAENYRDEVMVGRAKMQALVEKSNQTNQALEQLSAENRVLRKMAGVPDDYQFELNDIVQEGQLQVEKYRAQVRALEEEVEELEEERARLRRRLRENQIGGEVGTEYVEDAASRKAMKQELQELKYQNKKYEEELYHQKEAGGGGQSRYFNNTNNNNNNEGLEELMKQNNEMKDQLTILVNQAGQTTQVMANGGKQMINLQPYQGFAQPPTPLPGAFGNYNDIKDGMSHRFKTKLPVDMNHLQSDGGQLDPMQVKYEMASLQLQNVETLRLLQEKEKEYVCLQNEVAEIKDDIRKKFLLVQDELFMQHHREKTEWKARLEDVQLKHAQLQETVIYQRVEIDKYGAYMEEVERRNPDTLQAKLSEMTKRSAILDVNLIKLARRYEALNDEYRQIKESFIHQQADYVEKERDLLEKLYNLIRWKKNTSAQMKLMLTCLQQSMPLEEFHLVRAQKEQGDEKLAHAELRLSDQVRKVALLESAERDVYEKGDRIRILEEELIEVQFESEIVKKRLEALDPYFRKFQLVYTQMVDYIKMKNVSPLEMFKQFDQNGDGKIQKNEFQLAIRDMGIPINNEEMEVLYMFVDLDGTGEIEYQEFVRRLRRSGVTTRKKEDQLLFTLYGAIKETGLSLRAAFETFDSNGDGIISKQDMSEVLRDMKLNVGGEVIDYIFKIADTSGDNQISYEEFTNLFEGIVKTQMQEDTKLTVTELDWKMAVMVQIDAAVKEQNLTLFDAFKMIDRDDNLTVSLREFSAMFEGMGLQLPQQAIKDLFACMDRQRNGEISYNEMLNYLRESKMEEEKLRKLKFIQQRTKQMQDEIGAQNASGGQNSAVMTVEGRLSMKIAILEMREKNANARTQTLIQQLGYSDGLLAEVNKKMNELQHQFEKTNEVLFRERAEGLRLTQRAQGSITREESDRIRRLNDMQKLELIDVKSALTTYRGLYDTAVTQTKIMRLTMEKVKNDQDTLQHTIKELQSNGDQNAIIGKLYHHVMISRWNEGQTNQRYEKLLDDMRRLKLEEASYEALMLDKQAELTQQTQLFRETILTYEKQVTDARAKLLPSVTLQRVEEQANRIREIADMKFEVEKQNRQLREQFYELQLKADYFDIYKHKLDELEQRLKSSNPDELSQQIIEVSEKYSECKIESLKANRDLAMAREKEEYYQRLNRQYTDTIKKMEFDQANADLVLRKREEDWRRKFYDQRKTIFAQLGVEDQGLGGQLTKMEKKNQEDTAQMTKILSKHRDSQPAASELDVMAMRATIEGLESENKKKQIEIEGLINRHRIAGTGGNINMYNSQQLETYTKDVLAQEVEKLSMAAQQTIKCLQDIIRDKDAQVERKELQIESVKKEAMMHKKRDLDQISQLQEVIHQRGQDRMTEQINLPQQQSFVSQQQDPVMLQNFQHKLKEKDTHIKQAEISLEAERRAMKTLKQDLVRVLNEKEQLQADLLVESKRNETEQYRKQVDSLQKLVKARTKELVSIKATVTALKTEVFKVAEEGVTKEQEYNTKESRMTVHHSDLELKMKAMLGEVKKLKLDIKAKQDDLDLVKMNEIELKAKMTDLTKSNTELKALIGQVGGSNNRRADDVDEQVLSLTTKLNTTNALSIENATLQREVLFLKSQGQAKNLFDKEGNLQSQNNQIYFKSVEELFEGLRVYLSTKPRLNLLVEFERNDKDKKRMLSFAKFFEVLGMVGLKFKTRDLKLLQDAVKLDKGDTADYYHKFYYKIKNIQDDEAQCGGEQAPQQLFQQQQAYGKK